MVAVSDLRAQAGVQQDRRREVHDRVDAGELGQGGQTEPERHDAPHPGRAQVAPAGPRFMRVGGDTALDLGELRVDDFLVAYPAQRACGVLEPAAGGQPAGRLGHEQHPEPQQHGRDRGDREHPAPHTALAHGVGHDRVRRVGQQLARHDHQFVLRHETAAVLGGRQLGDEHRHRRGRAAHGESEQYPEQHHHRDVGCERGAQRADEEQHGESEDRPLASVAVAETAPEQGPEGRAEHERRRDDPFGQRAETQPAVLGRTGHEGKRAGDDAGVVAEEKSAEGGDDGDGP